MYIAANPRNKYLFENKFGTKYSERWIRQVFQNYCEKAKIGRIHPHLLRHLMITYLTQKGWTDEQIMLLSGHASKESLKIYQHLSLADIEKKFNEDMRDLNL